MEKPREIAVRVLRRLHASETDRLEAVLEQELSRISLPANDRALLRELVFGVVRWQLAIDWVIARKTQGRQQKPLLQILLRLGIYQAFWLDRIPDHAIVNESVQLARELGCGPQSGFINALLRGCLRERLEIRAQLDALKSREPHLGYSHPLWLWTRWEKRWPQEQLRRLLEWNNTPAPIYARVNTLKVTPDQLAARFATEGVQSIPRNFAWTPPGLLFLLQHPPPLRSLPSFQEGLFYIQDPSTLLAVRELNPQPGDRILDLCAAPGGKATFIAQLLQNQTAIDAEDSDSQRLTRLRQNCERLGVTCIRIGGTDGQAVGAQAGADLPSSSPAGKPTSCGPDPTRTAGATKTLYDRILVDAPCSNTGVMRRRVELRWRVQPAEIERLQAVQLRLLQRAASRLQPKGTLVYSTCSLEPEENEVVVRQFLEHCPGFRLEQEHAVTPFAEGVDGVYVARLAPA